MSPREARSDAFSPGLYELVQSVSGDLDIMNKAPPGEETVDSAGVNTPMYSQVNKVNTGRPNGNAQVNGYEDIDMSKNQKSIQEDSNEDNKVAVYSVVDKESTTGGVHHNVATPPGDDVVLAENDTYDGGPAVRGCGGSEQNEVTVVENEVYNTP